MRPERAFPRSLRLSPRHTLPVEMLTHNKSPLTNEPGAKARPTRIYHKTDPKPDAHAQKTQARIAGAARLGASSTAKTTEPRQIANAESLDRIPKTPRHNSLCAASGHARTGLYVKPETNKRSVRQPGSKQKGGPRPDPPTTDTGRCQLASSDQVDELASGAGEASGAGDGPSTAAAGSAETNAGLASDRADLDTAGA